MEERIEILARAVERWDERGWPRPDVVLVSGSGLAVDLHPAVAGPVDLAELLPFPVHAIVGHPHQVELIRPRPDRTVLYYRGRLHHYQGYDAFETVFPIRLAALLGARVLVMTNSAGGVSPALAPGDLALVRDHLNLASWNPLRGEHPASWGPRFPDMTDAYSRRLRELAGELAGRLGVALELTEAGGGVYAGVAGPTYETPAEVRMLRTLGADLVGMSTVPEVIAAGHMGLECLVVSLVANVAAGVSDEPLVHDEVVAAGESAAAELTRLLRALLEDARLTA